jgi:hypothetical protein
VKKHRQAQEKGAVRVVVQKLALKPNFAGHVESRRHNTSYFFILVAKDLPHFCFDTFVWVSQFVLMGLEFLSLIFFLTDPEDQFYTPSFTYINGK